MEKKYNRTNLYIIDEDNWKWAKFRASKLGFNSVSEYVFKVIEVDRIAPEILTPTLIRNMSEVKEK